MQGKVNLSERKLNELLDEMGYECDCGKLHKVAVKDALIEKGALAHIMDIVKKYGGSHPFIIADKNTYTAAGETVYSLLDKEKMQYTGFIFQQEKLEPDEFSVGKAVMHFDSACDLIIGVGSGTINDICKMIAKITGLKYIIVCTAPSMDGFASSISSMLLNGVKVSLNSACPVAIIADTDILCHAPMKLLQAGLGDMLAKYISICEWRISHVINREYYCEEVAGLIRSALKKCVLSAEGILKRDPEAVANITEGLVMAGIAMSFAGVSRPASGMEHYFSHIWEMRALRYQKECELHGIQVGVGTLLSLRIYDTIRHTVPDRQKAIDYVEKFEHLSWENFLRDFLDKSGESLIQLEKKEGKYNKQKHATRVENIINNWRTIVEIISLELPEYSEIEELLRRVGAPVKPEELNLTKEEVRDAFIATKDIRDKYVGSRLLWDLGLIEEVAEKL